MFIKSITVLLSVIVFMIALSQPGFAQEHIYIDQATGINDPSTLGTVSDPFKSITYAFATMIDRSTPDPWIVHIKAGTYDADTAKPGDEREVFPIDLREGMVFQGDDGVESCIISGAFDSGAIYPLLRGENLSSVTIKDLTLKDMIRTDLDGDGGAVYLYECAGSMEGCVVKDNKLNTTLIGNYRGFGGGLYVHSSGSFTLSGNTFKNNLASGGGGCYLLSGAYGTIFHLINNIFISNSTTIEGGSGAYITDSNRNYSLNATDNAFHNNYAPNNYGALNITGHAIENDSGSISNNIFTGNTGGAINLYYVFQGDFFGNIFSNNGVSFKFLTHDDFNVKIDSNVFSNNPEGAFYLDGWEGEPSQVEFSNNLFLNNTIASSSSGGTSIRADTNMSLINNTFYESDTGDSCIKIETGASNSILKNNIFSDMDTAILAEGESNLTITHNDFYNLTDILNRNNQALGDDPVFIELLLPGCSDNKDWDPGLEGEGVETGTLDADPVFDVGNKYTTLTDSTKTWTTDQWKGALYKAENTYHYMIVSNTASQLMVKGNLVDSEIVASGQTYTIDDFHLAIGSQNINQGTTTSAVLDMEGDHRPQGASFDIGADEFDFGDFYQYTIPATSTIGGSVSPAGDVIVVHGSDQTFTFTPDAEHNIVDVEIDGTSQGTISNYTFEDVIAAHTVHVRFIDDIPPNVTGLTDSTTPIRSKTWNWDADETATFRFEVDQNPSWTPTGLYSSVNTTTLNSVDGTWYLHVQAKDTANNESIVITVSALLDNTALVPAGIDLALEDDTGISNSDNKTKTGSDLTISGSGEEGATVQLYDNGSIIQNAFTIISGGVFSIDIDLAEGSHNITAIQTDIAGNVSAPSISLVITVDGTALPPTGLDLAAEDDTGTDSTDDITNINSGLTITGSGEDSAIIQLYDNSVPIPGALGTVSGGMFSIDISLDEAVHNITGMQIDIAGNYSAYSTPLVITIDNTVLAPEALDLAEEDDTGSDTADNLTSIISGLTITGTGVEGETVQLYDNDIEIPGAFATVTGSVFTMDIDLAEGLHSITAQQTDLAGNISDPSTVLDITVDTEGPTVNITNPEDESFVDLLLGIGGDASDTSSISLVELQITDGIYYVDESQEFTPTPTWVTATGTDAWSFKTIYVLWSTGTRYDITARATDTAGNISEGYSAFTFGIEPSTITCVLSNSTITLGEGITLSGIIDPIPIGSAPGLCVMLFPPGITDPEDPSVTIISIPGHSAGDFGTILGCEYFYTVGTWNIITKWDGNVSHLGNESEVIPLIVEQADTDLIVDIMASANIKEGSEPPIVGKLTAEPVCSEHDLLGKDITLTFTDPSDNSEVITVPTYSQYGQFDLDYDTSDFVFNEPGQWTIEASFDGTSDYNAADAVSITVNVVKTAGYAIIVEGQIEPQQGEPYGEGLMSHNKTTRFVNKRLRDRGLLDDDIMYFSWILGPYGMDSVPSKSGVEDAITIWARDKIDPAFTPPTPYADTTGTPGDLYIIMTDHGWTQTVGEDEQGVFFLDDEQILSSDLAGWLDTLQTDLVNAGINRNIVVVLGFCRAGAFIEDVSDLSNIPAIAKPRVIIASASEHEPSHRGPKDLDDPDNPYRDGEYFVSEFFKAASNGDSIGTCFEKATSLTEVFTSSGSGLVNAPYFDDAVQHPLLDDNADLEGSNVITDIDEEDGNMSKDLFIGVSPEATNGPGDDMVLVTRVCDPRFLEDGDDSVDLWATVDVPTEMLSIWAEVKQPGYDPGDPGPAVQIEMDTYKNSPASSTDNTYYWDDMGAGLDLFDGEGTYQVFYFAKHKTTKTVSPLIQSKVYRKNAANDPPEPIGDDITFDLLLPTNGASVRTTLILDWDDLEDPQGDSFSYRVLLSKGTECFDETCTDRIVIDDVPYSTCLAVLPVIDWDDIDVYWKVQAIDEYGEVSDSNVMLFHTDNNNPPMGGWIEGHVIDNTSPTADPVDNAAVTIGATTLYTALGGYYLGVISDAGTYSVNADSIGFDGETHPAINISEGTLITRDFELNANSDDTDSDGLTDYDELYTCTYDTAYDDADSDDDGILDGDEDANLNGEVDAGETDPGDADTDNDGIQDGTELGITTGHADTGATFQPDLDPTTTTDPLDNDTDDDSKLDGDEDSNHNGRVDAGETDPNPMASIPTVNEWGMIVFMILLMVAGTVLVRRQRAEG